MQTNRYLKPIILNVVLISVCYAQGNEERFNPGDYLVYPEVNDTRPELPSPFVDAEGTEWVVAVTKDEKYAIIPVSLTNDRGICKQLVVDTDDFPELARTGLHSTERLSRLRSITGRSTEEITRLGRPNGLSTAGFMAEDEDIVSVLKADNWIVSELGLTHRQLATPLFHVLNMMDTDLTLGRWNMAIHQWENIRSFFYNGRTVYVEAYDTKGGQKSIFDDDIEGAFYIKLWRELNEDERRFLDVQYPDLTDSTLEKMTSLLSSLNSGEMQPQYIMRYGFYEGHTYWRTDPITLSFLFGLRSIAEIEDVFPGVLDLMLISHFTGENDLQSKFTSSHSASRNGSGW